MPYSNAGLPDSYPTAFPDMRALQRGAMEMHPMMSYPEPDRLSAMDLLPPHQTTQAAGAAPTPLVGPGNTPNPPVTILGGRAELPVPQVLGSIPQPGMSPQAAGMPGASASPIGMLAQPGSLVKPPLIPGMPSAMVPNTPPDVPGFGSR